MNIFRRWVIRLFIWIACVFGYRGTHSALSRVQLPSAQVIDATVVQIKRMASHFPEKTGDWKRHQIYAKLVKMFPGESKRSVGLAIELVLSGY